MGLKQSTNATYVSIADGKLRVRTDENDSEAKKRYDAINQKYLYERVYTSIEGFIRGIREVKHPEYGTSYKITFVDSDGETFIVSLNENSKYFISFAMHLPNIDFSKMVTLKPYSFKSNGYQVLGITIYQDGKKLDNYFIEYDKDKNRIFKNGMEKYDPSNAEDDSDWQIMKIKRLKFIKKLVEKIVDKNNLNEMQTETEPNEPKNKSSDDPRPKASEKTDSDVDFNDDDLLF